MVRFFDDLRDEECRFVVIIARSGGKFVFCRHIGRTSWEFPGGHIEAGETAMEAAKRELNEETGATVFEIKRAFGYSATRDGEENFGIVYTAEVEKFGDRLEMEIEEIRLENEMPEEMTYPDIQPVILKEARERGFI